MNRLLIAGVLVLVASAANSQHCQLNSMNDHACPSAGSYGSAVRWHSQAAPGGGASLFGTVAAHEFRGLVPVIAPASNDESPESGSRGAGVCGLKAFPEAMGYGQYASGGRGGRIVHVMSLADSGPGTLRWALEQISGARIVVFDVEGRIRLTDEINIKDPYVTIAGQSAPGEGIVLSGARLKISTHDVIVRGMKIRPGDDPNGDEGRNRDALSIGSGAENVIIDHNSFTWAVDENVAVWGRAKNITISNNIIAEALHDSIHVDEKKGDGESLPHSMGLIVGSARGEPNSENITITGNLLISNHGRNPLIKRAYNVEVINNYVTNYGAAHQGLVLGGGRAPLTAAVIKNYYEDGIDTKIRETRPPFDLRNLEHGSMVYLHGNYQQYHQVDSYHGGLPYVVNFPPFELSRMEILDSSAVPDYVRANAGARVNGRLDPVDNRIVGQATNGTSQIIDRTGQVGGFSVYNFTGQTAQDTDLDGMPDTWEDTHGFNKHAFEAHGDSDSDGYSNIEEYLNGLITYFDANAGPIFLCHER